MWGEMWGLPVVLEAVETPAGMSRSNRKRWLAQQQYCKPLSSGKQAGKLQCRCISMERILPKGLPPKLQQHYYILA